MKVLQHKGYIDVQPDPNDGRGKLVFLTETGRSFREDAIVRVSAMFKDTIGEDQIAIMRRIRNDLEQMRKHLDDNR